MSSPPVNKLTNLVRRQYEAYPYPHYPLLATPKWHEGWLSPSMFSAKLFENYFDHVAAVESFSDSPSSVLVAGCGEVLPYVLRKYEKSANPLTCVDLSQSSLKRARFRLLANLKPTELVCSDIGSFLESRKQEFSHVDIFGVLHHLSDPTKTVQQLSSSVRDGATARVMVYNSKARRWIRELQKAFSTLMIDPYRRSDLTVARRLLDQLAAHCPAIDSKLQSMGRKMLDNDAQFVDTFLHAREANISITKWLEIFASAGFELLGLFDRYGELDDIENPLWNPPSVEALEERADDYRYENNLELFVAKPLKKESNGERQPVSKRMLLTLMTKSAPKLWFSFEETKDIPSSMRKRLWRYHVRYVHGSQRECLDSLFDELPVKSLKRLARLGVVFPFQFTSKNRSILSSPIEACVERPSILPARSLLSCSIKEDIERVLRAKEKYSQKRVLATILRMERAQA